MPHSLTTLALIPARAGSKGVPLKNIKDLSGEPLIARTINTALASEQFDRVVVSTDDNEIADIARHYGAEVPFIRPDELAQDDTPGMSVVLHALEWLDDHEGYSPDYLMLLQPTSPLREIQDIKAALALVKQDDCEAVVSLSPVRQHPFWMKQVSPDGCIKSFLPDRTIPATRQELPEVFSVNGAIYLSQVDLLKQTGDWYSDKTRALMMPEERSLDIDSSVDFKIAQLMTSS